MNENSKKYLTVNTHREMFTYNRLPFWGVLSPCNLPENYGGCPPVNSPICYLLRQYPCYLEHKRGTSEKPVGSVKETGGWSQTEEE